MVALVHLLIRLHPQPFREEFGVEMYAVLDARLSDARAGGRLPYARAYAHEIFGLARNLLSEHRLLWKGKQPMSESRRVHLYSLLIPLGLAILLLIVNPNFIMMLFTSGLGWLIALTFVLTIGLIALTFQPRFATPRRAAMAALLSLLAVACLLGGTPLVMVLQFDPTLAALHYTALTALALIDIAILAVVGAAVASPHLANR